MAHAMLSLPDTVLLLVAGVLAGIVGTAGAITSLVSYPALLLAGVPALAANIANIVAITTTWPASALASRAELAGRRRWLRRYAPVAALGGALGTALLLRTSADTFERVVPFLVAIGSLALLVAPRLTARRRASTAANTEPWWLAVGLLFISIYNGYFGAGAGVMTLALVLVASGDSLPVANALKNMLVGAATLVAAIGLVIFTSVTWGAVVPLGIGTFVGGAIGPRVTRRLPERALRILVAAIGLGLAVQLWVTHGS
jgi:uncharacterized membrane protein YfcA